MANIPWMRVSKLVGLVIFSSKGSKVGTVKSVSLDLEAGCVSKFFYSKKTEKGMVEENFPFKNVKTINDKIVLR
jgi:sporulation protein YlmC with PRC-barrel domain